MLAPPQFLFDGPANAAVTIALAHGAGAAMDSPFMNAFAAGLAKAGLRVARFEFPYMAARRRGEHSGPPDREPVLRDAWRRVIDEFGPERLVIGGKSLGGRMASLVADEARVKGLVCLGYPFHPTGKPQQLRVAHLAQLATRALIVQGERDPFGTQSEVAGYSLAPSIQFHWLVDGDHSFKPRKASGRTEQQNWDEGIAAVARFVGELR